MSLSPAAVAGIVAGSIVAVVLLFVLFLVLFRAWMRGPTKGSDNPKRLDGNVRTWHTKKVLSFQKKPPAFYNVYYSEMKHFV